MCVMRRLLCIINFYVVHPLEATVLLQSSRNFTRMFGMMISLSGLNMGHVESKTRSLGQISLKPSSSSRGQFCFSPRNFTRMFVWIIFRSSLNMGDVGSKTRSLG